MKLDSVRELKSTLFETLLADVGPKTGIHPHASPRGSSRAASVGHPPAISADLALGISARSKGDYRLAIRVQRRTLQSQAKVEAIQKRSRSEMDLRYIGAVTKCGANPWHQRRNRPLLLGGSVGHYLVTAGTLGGFVRVRKNQSVLILSNNHVLANENQAKAGDPILQPGGHDGGRRPRDVIAKLDTFVRIKKRGANFVDAAVATLEDKIAYDAAELTGLGKLAGLGPDFLDEGLLVSKVGRTTGLTHGRVTAFELDDVGVDFDAGACRFDGQIEIEGAGNDPFSDGGDSGSLIVDGDRRAIALLFAGSDQGGTNGQGLTFANPLHPVLAAFGADLVI